MKTRSKVEANRKVTVLTLYKGYGKGEICTGYVLKDNRGYGRGTRYSGSYGMCGG